MKILKWIGIILLLLAVIIVLVGLISPREQFLTSSTEINLTPGKVFYSVATFTDRQSWDPWLEMDPGADVVITTVPGYVGSNYTWDGEKLGSGRMVVDSVVFPTEIHNSLFFGKSPQPSHVTWSLSGTEGGTGVEWSVNMVGTNPFVRLMNAIMKKSMTKSLEKGLSNLKTKLETNGVKMSSLSEPAVREYPGMDVMVAEGEGSMEEISSLLEEYYGAVMKVMAEQDLQPAGPPFAMYFNYSEETGRSGITAGVPVVSTGKSSGIVKARKLDGFRAFAAIHSGPYTEFNSSYETLIARLQESGFEMTGTAWEFYLTDPGIIKDESQWKTEIAMEIK